MEYRPPLLFNITKKGNGHDLKTRDALSQLGQLSLQRVLGGQRSSCDLPLTRSRGIQLVQAVLQEKFTLRINNTCQELHE